LQPRVHLRRLLPLILLLLALPGCGVAFFESFSGTELFKHLQLEGDFVAGGQMTISIDVNDAYPVPIRVACYYEKPDSLTKDEKRIVFHERATLIGERVLPASPGTKPDDDVSRQTLSFPFSIDEPGDYFAACITPASPENGIGKRFTVEPAVATTAP
jgi:hypothetical protein